VKLRKEALARMGKGARAEKSATSVTMEQAGWAKDQALDKIEDPIEAGSLLVDATKRQAAMMHFHLAKMLGKQAKN
jgi:hypothetical protein